MNLNFLSNNEIDNHLFILRKHIIYTAAILGVSPRD